MAALEWGFSLSGLRTTGGVGQMTCRSPSAESVPAEERALTGRGEDRAFFNCGPAWSAANRREVGRKKNVADFVIPPVQFAATCTPSSPIERLSSLPIYRWRCAKKAKRSTPAMTAFYSVVTFGRPDDLKNEKIMYYVFLRKKTYCYKYINIRHLER